MEEKFIIAIDLGGTNLRVALFDSSYRIIFRESLDTKKISSDKNSLIAGIIISINGIIKEKHLDKKDILGIGLGVPGPVDNEKGIIHFFPNIPGWKEVNFKSILSKKTLLPVFLDNDANLMALAEYKLGAGKGYRNVIGITLGTGVGGGIILEGDIYRGRDNAAGEIGHIPINENGPRCNCGNNACLEAYIGNNSILREAKKIFKRDITLEELSRLAKRQNKKAVKIWFELAAHLGVALAGVINLLNPDCIVIGGGVANAGKVLFSNIRKFVFARAMRVHAQRVKIFKSKLGTDAGLIGAALLVKGNCEAIFRRPRQGGVKDTREVKK